MFTEPAFRWTCQCTETIDGPARNAPMIGQAIAWHLAQHGDEPVNSSLHLPIPELERRYGEGIEWFCPCGEVFALGMMWQDNLTHVYREHCYPHLMTHFRDLCHRCGVPLPAKDYSSVFAVMFALFGRKCHRCGARN